MAKSISQLTTQATANETDLFEVAIADQNSASGYASKKESAAAIAEGIVGSYQYPLLLTKTTAKTVTGAINELIDLFGYTELTDTLTAGATTLTFTDASIQTTSTFDYYTDIFGVNPTAATVATGTLTLTFDAQSTDMIVKVRVS